MLGFHHKQKAAKQRLQNPNDGLQLKLDDKNPACPEGLDPANWRIYQNSASLYSAKDVEIAKALIPFRYWKAEDRRRVEKLGMPLDDDGLPVVPAHLRKILK